MSQDQEPRQAPNRTLELLWGMNAPPSRGPKPALSLEQVVRTGVRVADAEGLGAVSMRRVADELGFTTMSLYRYVPSKDDLIQLMWDAAASPPDLDDAPEEWRAGMSWWARQSLDMFRRHPWFFEIPISNPPMGPNHVRWMECALRSLSGTGLYSGEKIGVMQLVSTYIMSAGRLELTLTQGASSTGVDLDEWNSLYGQMLARVVDPEELPNLASAIRSGIFDGPDPSHGDGPEVSYDDDVSFGLEIILDGVAALISRRHADDQPR